MLEITEITHNTKNNVHFYGCAISDPENCKQYEISYKEYLNNKRFDLGAQEIIHLWIFDHADNVPKDFNAVGWEIKEVLQHCLVHAHMDHSGEITINYEPEKE